MSGRSSREPRRTASEADQEVLRFKEVSIGNDTTVGIIEHPNRRTEWLESTRYVEIER